jgi:glycosyltransferase involved in cell wall biosynthesis
MDIILVIYGSLDQVTGGYLYDRKVVERLRLEGTYVQILSLRKRPYLCTVLQGFTSRVRDLLGAEIEKGGSLIVIDELAHPSFFIPLLFRLRPVDHLVTLVHHLRADERIGPVQRLIAVILEKVLLNRSAFIVVNSSNTENSVRHRMRKGATARIQVCRPGCDTLREPAGEAIPTDREPSTHGVQLLTVGNVIPRKGHMALLNALTTMSELSWHLTVVGRDDPRTRYSRRLHTSIDEGHLECRIRFTGTVEDEALVRLYTRADLFLFPSSHEGYGIALAEALRFGLPFVAFDSGGIREITGSELGDGFSAAGESNPDPDQDPLRVGTLKNGRIEGLHRCRGGFLVAWDHPETFRVLLRRLIEDGELRRQLSAGALERSRELPTWEETGACFSRALRALAGG